MVKLTTIECDLAAYKITLQFRGKKEPLIVQFDTPSRRFHFSIIALIINEMKKKGNPAYIHIRKYQKVLEQLDKGLAGKHASKHIEGMWAKINMAWRHRLPDLEAAALFKVLDRDLIPPYEKGGKYRYECSDVECDTWANLFSYDENNKWRFKFAIESASIQLDDIKILFGNLKGDAAWNEFLNRLRIKAEVERNQKKAVSTIWKKPAFYLIAVLIICSAAWITWHSFSQPSPSEMALKLPDKPSIAVLPFKNLSDDLQQEYLADGIVEGIIMALGNVPKVFVIASNSTFSYKGKSVKVQQVSEELGVRYVLEGSVLNADDKVRITAQLIDAFSGHHLWAQRYDRYLNDIFAVQDEIIKNIITAMQVELTEGEQVRAAAKGTDNLEAYLKHLQALHKISKFDAENNALAKQLAQEAIALDPDYAVAYRDLALTHRMDVWLGTSKSPKQSMSKCMELLQKAIKLDQTYADAYSSMAFSLTMAGKHEKAVATAENAVALNPNSANAHAILANTLRFSGRPKEAIPEYKKAIRLNPIPPAYYLFGLGHAYSLIGQHEEAINWCKKAISVSPDSYLPHLIMTVVYSMAGREKDARAEAVEVIRINPKYSVTKNEKRATLVGKEEFFRALRKAGLK
jgi:TolB-like protein